MWFCIRHRAAKTPPDHNMLARLWPHSALAGNLNVLSRWRQLADESSQAVSKNDRQKPKEPLTNCGHSLDTVVKFWQKMIYNTATYDNIYTDS